MSAPWSNNPNAPQIPLVLYSAEKTTFAGYLIGSILHGIVIVLFFQCMNALLGPKSCMRKGKKWGLVVHTVALFLVTTTSVALSLYTLAVSYINDREFPGGDGIPPGPFGYPDLPKFTVINAVAFAAIQVNQWLVDGLLLYRCYVIYGNKYWAVAFPFVIYLASWATGIALIYVESLPYGDNLYPELYWGDAYYSIALSLNALLTLMLITRLVLHRKNILSAVGAQNGAGGLYKAIITMLVESGALYAAGFALFVGPWVSKSAVGFITFQIVPEIQCIAPFLIVLRVANRTALTSEVVASGNIGSIRFKSQGESTGSGGTIFDGNPIHSASGVREEKPGEHDAGAENATSL